MKKLWSYLFILIFWYLLSLVIQNDILLPSPFVVIQTMLEMLSKQSFYQHIGATVSRITLTVLLSVLLALGALVLSMKSDLLKQLLDTINSVVRTLPVVAFLMISLIWLGRELSIVVVGILIVFPMIFDFLLNRTYSINAQYRNVLSLYGSSLLENLVRVYLPLMLNALVVMLKSSILLAIKTTVNAEVLVAIMSGIGFQLSIARSNLDMISVLAYSGWMVLLSLVIGVLFDYLASRLSYDNEI